MKFVLLIAVALGLALGGCATGYTLVKPGHVKVAKRTLEVQPTSAWNRLPRQDDAASKSEAWTRNGPLLDVVTFLGGLPDGKPIVRQRKSDAPQVPVFHAEMGSADLASMVEASYRIQGLVAFEIASVEPTPFLGANGLQMDFVFVAADELPRRGRTVMSIIDDRLYAMTLVGAERHYFEAALPEFESMLKSASRR